MRRGAGVIDRRLIGFDRKPAVDAHGPGAEAVVVEAVFELVSAIGDGTDACPHHALGVVLERFHLRFDAWLSVLDGRLEQTPHSDVVGRDLRGEVSAALLGRAHVGENNPQNLIVDLSLLEQLHRREAQSLLIDLPRQRHRARRHAADIGVMRTGRQVVGRFSVFNENRRHGGDIGQVRAAAERVVENDDVARLERV